MTELVMICLLSIFLLYYLDFLWSIWKGLSSLSSPHSNTAPFASIVLAARNEEASIKECLRTLIEQSYDSSKYEIIVVDDHSHDNTVRHVNNLADSIVNPRITVVSLKDQSGKPAAITAGVSIAKGEIILCTDADCAVPRSWLESMVRCFDQTVALVAGPVLERASESLISRLQAIEYLSLTTTAAGLIGAGKPIICSGASIAYRRSAFTDVNGYEGLSSSCDDETLMQRMFLRNAGHIVFNPDPEAAVLTKTPSGLAAFWHQRTRWAAKKGRYEDASILRRLMLLYFFFLILFFCGLAALIEPNMMLPVIVVLLIKGASDYILLSRGARNLRQSLPIGQFLIAELFHVPYIAVAGLIGQFTSLHWKNRDFGR